MQSRTHSFLESLIQPFVGYFIALLVQYIVFPIYNISISHTEHFIIAGIFFAASVIRSYILRRIFNHFTVKYHEHEEAWNEFEY